MVLFLGLGRDRGFFLVMHLSQRSPVGRLDGKGPLSGIWISLEVVAHREGERERKKGGMGGSV